MLFLLLFVRTKLSAVLFPAFLASALGLAGSAAASRRALVVLPDPPLRAGIVWFSWNVRPHGSRGMDLRRTGSCSTPSLPARGGLACAVGFGTAGKPSPLDGPLIA